MKKIFKATAAAAVMAAVVSTGTLNVSAEGLRDVFDAKYYADTYADVKAAFGGDENVLFNHYMACGLAEGRQGNPAFNVVEYRKAYADLEAVFGDNWDAYVDHYRISGMNEGRTAGVTGTVTFKPASPAVTVPTEPEATTPASPAATLVKPPATSKEPGGEYGIEYDAEGRVIKEWETRTDGEELLWYVYEYDAAGNKIWDAQYDGTSTYPNDGILITWTAYEYNAEGYCIKETRYDRDGNVTYVNDYPGVPMFEGN